MKWHTADIIEYGLLKEHAKENRNNQTEAESAFWQMAKGSGLGEKCRRQYVIGEYIVDFFFRKSMLVIELDGGYHFPDPQAPLKEDVNKQPDTQLSGDILKDFSRPLRESRRGSEQINYDKQRQTWLEEHGYKVMRFTNEEVLFDTANTINKIKTCLKASI